MRPSKARSELSVGPVCHMRWFNRRAVHLRLSRQTPEVEAGCGKAARPVLCGGRIAICVPTAILISPFIIGELLRLYPPGSSASGYISRLSRSSPQ